MRFYGFDGRKFAEIRHNVPKEAIGDYVLQDVRRELVKYLFAVLPKVCHGRTVVVKGQIRHQTDGGEWHVVVEPSGADPAKPL